MNGDKFNISGHKKRVLVAPLEWGLGHATRCIPIIYELLSLDCEVVLAAEGQSKALLKEEFPQLEMLSIKSYRMRYSRKKYWLPFAILLQLPKIIASIANEKKWLKKIIKEKNIDAVISDNRFGLHSKKIPCVYIIHQLLIKTGNGITEKFAQRNHYRFINKYRECWVPDNAGDDNFAGELSHPKSLPRTPLKYIGPLSRFKILEEEKMYDLCVVISGPEPQRSIFEMLLLKELKDFEGKAILIRGLPGEKDSLTISNSNVEIKNHLSAAELNKVIAQSSLFIGRSGYTTVMDLVKLGKRAILVPTPGQTEQEYLAKYLMSKNLFYCIDQKGFDLKRVLQESKHYTFKIPEVMKEEYKIAVRDFVKTI